MKAIIVDDEIAALENLKLKLNQYCPEIEIIALCKSPKEGLKEIMANDIDVLFLDIEMPWMNGFELLDCLGDQINFEVVFVTAYDQYAIRAFKVKAIDYLLKPVDKDDLMATCMRLKEQTNKMSAEKFNNLKGELNMTTSSKKIVLSTAEGMEIVEQIDILFCKADSNYTEVHMKGNKKVLLSKTLSAVEDLLDESQFLRVHKSYTINLIAIKKYVHNDGGEVVLLDNSVIPVSRRRKEDLMKALDQL